MFSSWWSKGSAPNFSCELGTPVENNLVLGGGVFVLHSGTRKSGGTPVSVFVCSENDKFSSAVNAVKRLKTLRHPSVVTFADSVESEKAILLATEPVVPLLTHLESHRDNESYLAWGIYQIFKGISFLHEVGIVHGCLHAGSVFVTPGCEWKIFGLELSISLKGEEYQAPYGSKWPSSLRTYSPPELKNSSSTPPTQAQDLWGLGCIIWEVFNGPLGQPADLGKLSKIPTKLAPVYKELMSANPSKRPKASEKVTSMKSGSGYFKNVLIDTLLFLEEIQIKDEQEKTRFFTGLTEKLDEIPPDICKNKILPELIRAFDYASAGSLILAPVLKIGKHLSGDEYQTRIVPSVVKLFSSTDRNARYKLLSNVELFVTHLNDKVVNDQVYPQIENGFIDREPVIREKTVIAMIHLAPSLNFTNLDEGVVMKHFSRLLRDEQPGIRTNTTVCLGKVARYMHPSTRQKVLCSAFGAKLKDPFPPARIAAINALAATQQYYTIQDTSSRILPMLCASMTDPEKPVREQAFKVSRGFMEKLEQVSEDPSLKEEMEKEVHSTSSQVISAASSWASWAVGAIGAKFYKSAMKPPGETATQAPSTATTTSTPASTTGATSPSTQSPTETAKPLPSTSRAHETTSSKKEPTPKNDELINFDDDGDGWAEEDADWGDLEEISTSKSSNLMNKSQTESSVYDDFNKMSMQSKSDVVKQGIETLDMDTWNDWETGSGGLSLTSSGIDSRKQERDEKRLARQKEIEAKRAAKKGPLKLGAKKL